MQNKVLELLKDREGYVSGQEISAALGVSRQSVWKAVNMLRKQGCEINSVPNRGYKLIFAPEYLDESVIKSYLDTKIIGKNLVVLDSVGSTNEYLKSEGGRGCADGTVAAANEQTFGKGRLGRTWLCKKGSGIPFSILFRPASAPNEVTAVTPLIGLAVCRAIRNYTGLDCKIKWPNDIIVGSKKLVGILTEMSAEFDAVNYIVAGIGINVDNDSFPDEIAGKATSIFLETGKHINKNKFLAYLLGQIEAELLPNNFRFTPRSLEEYSKLCATIGRKITFTRNTKKIYALASAIDFDGELLAELDDGTVCKVSSGEVTVQGIY